MVKRAIEHWNWCSGFTRRAGKSQLPELNLSRHLLRSCEVAGYIDHRIVSENPAAALAEHDLVTASQILEELGTKCNSASIATSIGGIGYGGILRLLTEPLVGRIEVRIHLSCYGLSLGNEFCQLFLV